MRPFKHSGKQRFRPQVSGTFNGEQAGSLQEATPGKRTTLKPITKPTIVPDPTVVTVATAMVGPESTSFSQSPPTQAAPSASSPEIYSPATRADRCSVHPGMRNDYWCESIDLAAAYDDTFEAIELMQVKLVNHLKDTRHRNALLDSAAQVAMDEQLLRDTERSSLEERIAEYETLKMVQMMVEELSPAQTLLSISEQARPIDWEEPLPKVARIEEEVMPAWHYASVEVPDRGHVRVVSDAISAHGVVWQLEIRRSRSRLVVNRIDGCENIDGTFTVSVGLAKSESSALSRFRNESCNVWGQSSSSQTFNMCPLEDLKDSDTLTQSGSVSIRFGVAPESFRSLAAVQADRIPENGKGDMEQAALELQQRQIRRRRSDIRSRSEVKPDQMPIPGFTFGARPSDMPSAVQLPPALLSPISHAAAGSSSNAHTEKSSHQRSFSLTAKLRRQPPAPFPSSGHTRSLTSTPSTQSSESSVSAGVLRRLSGWVKTTEGSGHKGSPGAVDQQNSIDEWTFLDKSYPETLHCEAAEHVAGNGSPAGTKPPPPPPQIPLPPPPFAADFGAGFAFDGAADIEREQMEKRAMMGLGGEQEPLSPAALASPLKGSCAAGSPSPSKKSPRQQLDIDSEESIIQRFDALQLIANTVQNSRLGLSEINIEARSGGNTTNDPSPRRTEHPLNRATSPDSYTSPELEEGSSSEFGADGQGLPGANRYYALTKKQNPAQALSRRSISMDPREINHALAGALGGMQAAAGDNPPSPTLSIKRLPKTDSDSMDLVKDLLSRSFSPPAGEPTLSPSSGTVGMKPASVSLPETTAMDPLLSPEIKGASHNSVSLTTSPRQQRARRCSITSVTSSTSSISKSPARMVRPPNNGRSRESSSSESVFQPAASNRNGSLGPRSGTPLKNAAIDLQHLTPQANKTGGILKAGRSRRSKPTRLHNIASVASSFAVSGGDMFFANSETPDTREDSLDSSLARSIGSPLLKAGRSSTLPVIVDEAKLASTAVTPPSSKNGSMPRHPKSSQSTRKRVRFPDELRLLENIRLINPQVAQLHDERAAAAASARGIEHEDVNSLSPLGISAPREKRMGSPPPPAFDLSMALDADDEDDGLVSRIKHSLRKSVRQSADSLENREHSPSPPRSGSPEKFVTASSLLVEEVAEAPVDSPTNPATHSFQRQPIPSQLRAPVCFGGTTGDEYSRCLGKVSIDNSPSSLASAFEPCLSPSPPATDSQAATPQSQSVSGHSSRGTSMSSTLSASLAGLGMDQGRASITTTETDGSSVDLPLKKNNQGMHSSPMGSMPLQQGTPGTFSSAYRYTTDMMVFGVEQIPAIARGKNTAMSIFQQGSDTAHQ
ncbi:hypothetical protein DL89DRAFT_273160 [Linderina pennispora]|uniref:Uncharacterized protein n=1 Tax=Linderina pennispora TaxID=61395 RepID=A0A1Y1VQT0_9FUNG|nr:uncharacterized protein DL89DRAFT_273160 [Linderina pennispora]ORX63637.1 hypothetical protein DL89DRAFT_273160 [Linderina pennispora]